MKKHPIFFLIAGILSLIIAMGIGRFAYTPILPLMQNALGFSEAFAGYLAASNYMGYLIGAIAASILPLHNRRIFYLRISLLASIITTLMMGVVHSYFFMLLIRLISGIASAFIFVFASSIVLDKLAESNKTHWSGYFYSGVGFGIFFSTLFIPRFNKLFHWEGAWIGLAFLSGFLLFFIWLWLKESPNAEKKFIGQKVRLKTPPRKWLPWLIAAYGLEGLGYIITGTFIVSIAEETGIFQEPSIVWAVVGLAAIPSCIIWSELAKKWGFVISLAVSMILQSIGIVLPVFWLTKTSFIMSAILFGATFMGITTLATTLARQISPSNSSRVIGMMTANYAFGQMIGPIIAGLLLTYTHSFHSSLLGAGSAVFLGGLLLLSGIRFERSNSNETIAE